MPLPFALDHVNLWLIEDGDGWNAVDTGICLDALKDHWRSLLVQHRLTRQIVTHCHPDHLGLAAWLEQESGAPLWITQGEYAVGHLYRAGIDAYGIPAMLQLYRLHGLDEARLAALEERGNGFRRGVPEMPLSFRRIMNDEEIVIGGRIWRVIVGYGHAPEHASLYCEELNTLISGDMLLPRISTNVSVMASNPDGDPLALFLASIEGFLSLPQDTLVLPSHGKPFRGLHARVAQLQVHHRERCAALQAACATPRTAGELLTVLFGREITDSHQIMFAMGETIAHLNYLEHDNVLQRIDDNGLFRFIQQR
jgi:glyoxylase-like metal-dependent hydrolase (beta-lactamase superfamily II)